MSTRKHGTLGNRGNLGMCDFREFQEFREFRDFLEFRVFDLAGMYMVFNLGHAVGNKQRIYCFRLQRIYCCNLSFSIVNFQLSRTLAICLLKIQTFQSGIARTKLFQIHGNQLVLSMANYCVSPVTIFGSFMI